MLSVFHSFLPAQDHGLFASYKVKPHKLSGVALLHVPHVDRDAATSSSTTSPRIRKGDGEYQNVYGKPSA
ncbi:hypothetical protein Ancab_024706 [Ancistrocladus abbreviatus]